MDITMSCDNIENFVFLFYDGYKIDIRDLPGGWKFVESGFTYPISEIPTKYKYMMYFNGPKETKEEMKKNLDERLHFLQTKWNTIKFYQIQDKFQPVPF